MKNIIISVIITILLSSCASQRGLIPAEIPYYPKGAIAEVSVKRDYRSFYHRQNFKGELIAATDSSVILLISPEVLYNVPYQQINSNGLKLQIVHSVNRPNTFAALYGVQVALSITHGIFLLLSVPANLVIAAIGVSDATGYYTFIYRGANDIPVLQKFSRFPQGVPETIGLEQFLN